MERIDEIYRTRLRLLVKHQYHTQANLAAKIGKSPAQISQWINASPDSKSGKPRSMDRRTAREIESALGLPDGWMDQPISLAEAQTLRDRFPGSIQAAMSVDAVAHAPSQPGRNTSSETREQLMRSIPTAPGYVRLPIMAEAAAGTGRISDEAELIEHVDVAEDWVRRTLRANPASLRVLTARGHSMTGQVEDGDAMFVTPCNDFVDDGLYIISVGSLLRVKRLRLRVLDKVLSIESNDGSPAETIPLANADDALRICGKVVGTWSLKKF